MTKKWTPEKVEAEINRLKDSPAVALAKREANILNKRKQYMWTLQWLEKRGTALMEAGFNQDNIADQIAIYGQIKLEGKQCQS